MRTQSAAIAKRKYDNGCQDEPRPGTRLREVYDILLTNRGEWVTFDTQKGDGTRASYLRDFYGLDIVCKYAGRSNKYCHWILRGEWLGRTYVKYEKEIST